ncbi:hypothetical protein [Listeria marthii]|uniref:hypothetical protein n=1 Tax=Listeria marthii TaxID=529731 RepID=UPI0018877F3F|nr:hypothetical protein [Listeria marthii]MBF2515896.1 hypothetical protein [Listeria marthii]
MVNEVEKISIDNGVSEGSKTVVDMICSSLSIPRNVLPDSDSIDYALKLLPRELNQIKSKFRDKEIAKMCVAVSVGLYDDAIVRIWNSVIKEMKRKISHYGVEMIKHVASEKYADNFLENIKDSQLLILARQLNIISEQGFYFLDQCRDIRNNASIAHPTVMEISEIEMINFINRCNTYGLQDDYETKGLAMKTFISLLKDKETTDEQLEILAGQIEDTFTSQQELAWQILYSNSTNEESPTHLRSSSTFVAQILSETTIISEAIEANLLEKHNGYRIKGEEKKVSLSRSFLEKIDKVNNIDESEKIGLLNNAIRELFTAHIEANNFYNEPPFADRLSNLCQKFKPLPELVIERLVITVLRCYLGNGYGICWSAQSHYLNMLTELSPKGMEILLQLPKDNDYFKSEIKIKGKRDRYIELLRNIDENILTSKQKNLYNEYLGIK